MFDIANTHACNYTKMSHPYSNCDVQ